MIPFLEAKHIVNSHTCELDVELLPLQKCSGRILAENIVASFPSPQFDNSAMDGFAVRSEDTLGSSADTPTRLDMVSISAAGSPATIHVGPGECAQCMTGAKIPDGADAVIMVEDTNGFSNGDSIQIFLESHPGKHIRRKGEEISKGELLIQKGTKITASELGTCAAFGYGKLEVSRQPKIAIFGTGNELVEPGKKLKPGEIYNSNLYVFAELVERSGAEVTMRDVIRDDKASLRSFLFEALETCDIVISSGGVSMGRYDYVRDVFIELGVEEHFWKVAQKPGKPLFFGTGDSTLIFGLPGNPVSSYIGFMEWVWPAIETMLGEKENSPLTGILMETFPKETIKHRFLFGQAWLQDGKLVCKPSTKVGSHMLSSSLEANCILSSEPGDGQLQPGDEIRVNVLPWKHIQ